MKRNLSTCTFLVRHESGTVESSYDIIKEGDSITHLLLGLLLLLLFLLLHFFTFLFIQ